jgi:hypothetical protein
LAYANTGFATLIECFLLGFHVGLEVGNGLLHHAGGLHDLREEHLARTEQVADNAHAVHERALDDRERLAVFLAGLFRVFIDPSVDALHEGVGETRLDSAGAPGFEDGDVDFLILAAPEAFSLSP